MKDLTPLIENLPSDFDFEGQCGEALGTYAAGYDKSNPPIPSGKDYQATLRRFPSGQIEVCTVRIEALQRMQQSRYHLAGQPVRFTTQEQPEPTPEDIEKKAQESLARSIRRARQQVRWKLKQIQADHMVTLSYRENMQDVECLKRDWKEFVRLVHIRYPAWVFVAVREYQERGALHLHIGVKGRQDIKYLRRCWYRVLGAAVDAKGEEAPGNVDVSGPNKRWGGQGGYKWNSDKLAGYMTKYLYKSFEQAEKSSKRYWHSKKLPGLVEQKIWLAAANYPEAIRETFDLVAVYRPVDTMWSSSGWGCIWMTG